MKCSPVENLVTRKSMPRGKVHLLPSEVAVESCVSRIDRIVRTVATTLLGRRLQPFLGKLAIGTRMESAYSLIRHQTYSRSNPIRPQILILTDRGYWFCILIRYLIASTRRSLPCSSNRSTHCISLSCSIGTSTGSRRTGISEL